MVTRFSVIPDERRLLLGVDKENIFDEGMVYEATKVLDEIVLKPIGRFALPEKGHPSINSENSSIINCGLHLITEEENIKLKNHV